MHGKSILVLSSHLIQIFFFLMFIVEALVRIMTVKALTKFLTKVIFVLIGIPPKIMWAQWNAEIIPPTQSLYALARSGKR